MLSGKKRIMVFSPDPDLAFSVALALQNKFDVDLVNRLETFRERISAWSPDLLLIDLFAFQGEIAKLLVVLQSLSSSKPVVFFRGYRRWMTEIEEVVEKRASMIFYKPVEMQLVAESIQKILRRDAQQESILNQKPVLKNW